MVDNGPASQRAHSIQKQNITEAGDAE